MKNTNNKELLKRIKVVVEQYDKMGITLDSFLISGRETDYFDDKEIKIPSSESIYCSGYIDSERNKHPQILLAKFQLFNESVNSLINGALGKEDNEFTNSTFLRTTGIKRDK
jgi:hypothetical protein